MTKNGKIITELIETTKSHPTADEVYMLARGAGHTMSLATIYNNLSSLCEDGTLRKITTPEQPDRYDMTNRRHDHLLCAKCGKIKDLSLPDITDVLMRESGVDITSYDLMLMYVCDECKAQSLAFTQ